MHEQLVKEALELYARLYIAEPPRGWPHRDGWPETLIRRAAERYVRRRFRK
ncbi:MAG TPA: hypothetical protein VFT66_15800 [Roseiflexaceae bacterium]|nr:hypothetical protein [Roseiflexaceae bacterium]